MVIFNSKLLVYQRVKPPFQQTPLPPFHGPQTLSVTIRNFWASAELWESAQLRHGAMEVPKIFGRSKMMVILNGILMGFYGELMGFHITSRKIKFYFQICLKSATYL